MLPADPELWRLSKGARSIVCRLRELRMGNGHWDDYTAAELRVEHNGEIYLTEVHRDRVAFQRRVESLRASLVAVGWTSVEAS